MIVVIQYFCLLYYSLIYKSTKSNNIGLIIFLAGAYIDVVSKFIFRKYF